MNKHLLSNAWMNFGLAIGASVEIQSIAAAYFMGRAIRCLWSTPLASDTLPVHAVRASRKTSQMSGDDASPDANRRQERCSPTVGISLPASDPTTATAVVR
jgi:hypothetical protein